MATSSSVYVFNMVLKITSGFLTALECTKFVFGRNLQRSPDPSWFKGPTSKGHRMGGKTGGKGEKKGR